MASQQLMRFEDGAVQFRQRIVCSLLSHRPILLRNIRPDDVDSPGLRPYEVSFLRLIDALTNGTTMEINATGTQVRFQPGILIGGEVTHDCPVGTKTETEEYDPSDPSLAWYNTARSIGWFLEGILPLAPFAKEAMTITFTGITDGASDIDPSCDYLKASAFPLMEHFGIGIVDKNDMMVSAQSPSLRILRRGAAPLGGGQVVFYCPIVRAELSPIDLTNNNVKFKRIRGTAISCKLVSTSMTARVAYAAKGLLHRLLPDVWIHTDAHTMKHHHCGPSPSVSLLLTATSTSAPTVTVSSYKNSNSTVIMSAECCLKYNEREVPEDLGTRCAALLLEEIRRGGCIDTGMQSLALLWMCLSPEDVSRIRLGTLSPYTVESLRLFQRMLGVTFQVQADPESQTVVLSCLGTGYRNMARAAT
jgi:RNA 3'-terminal phosphate cyclase-like protein